MVLTPTFFITICALLVSVSGTPAIANQRFVDDAQRAVVVPDKVSRVFAAGAPAEILLYTLVPEMLAGFNHMPNEATQELMPAEFRTPVQIKRLPNANDGLNDAELLALRPDVYIDYGDINADYVNSVRNIQRRTGIPAIILDGSLDKIPDTYRRLGKLLGVSARGEALARQTEHILTTYRAMVRKLAAPPRVYLACSGDIAMPCLDGERSSEPTRWLGVVNVASEAKVEPTRRVIAADLVSWRPDVIVASTPESADHLLNDANWQLVAAVAARRVHAPPNLPFNWGPRPPSVNRLPGLMWLAYVLSGRPFDAELRADLKAFFSSFYHIEVSDAQLNKLLDVSSADKSASP